MLVPEFGNGKQALGCFDLLEVARHVGSQDHVYDQRAEFPVLFPRQVHQDVAVFLPHQSDAETEVNNLVDLMRFLCFLFVFCFLFQPESRADVVVLLDGPVVVQQSRLRAGHDVEAIGRSRVLKVVYDGGQKGGKDLQIGQPILQRKYRSTSRPNVFSFGMWR